MKKKRIFNLFVLLMACLAVMSPASAFAHSGRTDANGGHWDRKTGTYHYHNGGHSNSGGSSSSYYNYSNYKVKRKAYAKKVTVSKPPTSVYSGKSVSLKASVYPSNAEDNDIYWSSSNTSVATVDAFGNLSALSPGKAVITAKTAKGTSTKFTIVVKEIVAKSIHINSEPFDMYIDSDTSLDVHFDPTNTTYQDIEWTSSDYSVVSVNDEGLLVAKGLGDATITAKHGELVDSIVVKVIPILANKIEISKPMNLEIDSKSNLSKLKKKDSVQLEAKIFPYNTTDKTVYWSVDDNKKATVSDDGTVVAKKTGVVTITAKTNNGKTDTVQIKVYSDTAKYITSVSVILVLLAVFAYFFFKKH